MPVLGYFAVVGGVLTALLFAADAYMVKPAKLSFALGAFVPLVCGVQRPSTCRVEVNGCGFAHAAINEAANKSRFIMIL